LGARLKTQIDIDQDGKAGMPEAALGKLPFIEGPGFAKRSDVQGESLVDMASIGLTRIVDQELMPEKDAR